MIHLTWSLAHPRLVSQAGNHPEIRPGKTLAEDIQVRNRKAQLLHITLFGWNSPSISSDHLENLRTSSACIEM